MPAVDLPSCPIPPVAEVSTGEQWRQQHPTWLLAALRSGTITDRTGRGDDTTHPLEVHGLGDLPLPDGRVVGCDPYLAEPDHTPFALTVPVGEHPVAVGLVRIAADHVRPTALLVVTGTAPVVRWSLATTVAEDGDGVGGSDEDEDLGPGVITGYGVDAGCGAMFSPQALPALVEVGAQDGGMLEDPLSTAMFASPIQAALLPPRPGALPVAQCLSGWGDGVYATWVGWGAAGGVSLLMTDFAVTGDPWTADDEPAEAASVPAAPEPSRRGGFWSRLFGGGGR